MAKGPAAFRSAGLVVQQAKLLPATLASHVRFSSNPSRSASADESRMVEKNGPSVWVPTVHGGDRGRVSDRCLWLASAPAIMATW